MPNLKQSTLLLVLALLLTTVLSACGDYPSDTPLPVLAVGTFDDLTITIQRIEYIQQIKYQNAAAGEQYVVITADFKIKTNGATITAATYNPDDDASTTVNPFLTSIEGSNKVVYHCAEDKSRDVAGGFGEGVSVFNPENFGKLVYEVPTNTTPSIFIYSDMQHYIEIPLNSSGGVPTPISSPTSTSAVNVNSGSDANMMISLQKLEYIQQIDQLDKARAGFRYAVFTVNFKLKPGANNINISHSALSIRCSNGGVYQIDTATYAITNRLGNINLTTTVPEIIGKIVFEIPMNVIPTIFYYYNQTDNISIPLNF